MVNITQVMVWHLTQARAGDLQVFWFGLDKCQVPTKTCLSLPLLNWTGERKYDERLKGRDKDRERSLTNYHHGQNNMNLGRKGKFSLLPIKSEQDKEK